MRVFRSLVSVIMPGLLLVGTAVAAPARDPGGNPFDAGLAMQVAERIARSLPGATAEQASGTADAYVYGHEDRWSITVNADPDGHVALAGRVADFSVVRGAIDAARRVPSVRVVENEIRLTRPDDAYGFFPYGYPYAALPEAYSARSTGAGPAGAASPTTR